VPYVLVQHRPGVWLEARVEKQWRHEGRWRLSAYYYVGLLQHYRVCDADQCRALGPAVPEPDEVPARQSHPFRDFPGLRVGLSD
jgi:hypothetical protein